MDNGSKRSGPPEDSSSSRAKQLFGPPIYPDAKRRIMMKCIAAVLIVLGMFMTAGVTPYSPRARVPIHEPNRVSWAEFRKDPRHRKAFRRTSAKNYLYTLVPGTWYTSTRYCCCVRGTWYVFCISRRHLLRPATRAGTFSALGWDRLPFTAVA